MLYANEGQIVHGACNFCQLFSDSTPLTEPRDDTDFDCRRQSARSTRAAHFAGLSSDWQVCGEAVDGADAVNKAQQLAPDLILMDFSMPQMDGVQAAREIAKSGADIPILLFSLNLSPEIMEMARNNGLRGAISKSEISKLPYAIKALQRGETFFYAS